MNWRTWTIAALAIALVAPNASAQSVSPDSKWHWVWVRPKFTKGWQTFEGDAAVTMSGNRFHVTLAGSSGGEEASMKLDGSIKGKSVSAMGIEPGTDAGTWRYVGTIDRQRTKLTDPSRGWGFDIITLRSDNTFIGLYRDVRSTK